MAGATPITPNPTRDVFSQAELDAVILFNAGPSNSTCTPVLRGDEAYQVSGSGLFLVRDKARVTAVGQGTIVASEDSEIWATHTVQVEAEGHARVEAGGDSRVTASGNSQVVAFDQAVVEADQAAVVVAHGRSAVDARGHTVVIAHDQTVVVAEEDALVWAGRGVTVDARNGARLLKNGHPLPVGGVRGRDFLYEHEWVPGGHSARRPRAAGRSSQMPLPKKPGGLLY